MIRHRAAVALLSCGTLIVPSLALASDSQRIFRGTEGSSTLGMTFSPRGKKVVVSGMVLICSREEVIESRSYPVSSTGHFSFIASGHGQTNNNPVLGKIKMVVTGALRGGHLATATGVRITVHTGAACGTFRGTLPVAS